MNNSDQPFFPNAKFPTLFYTEPIYTTEKEIIWRMGKMV